MAEKVKCYIVEVLDGGAIFYQSHHHRILNSSLISLLILAIVAFNLPFFAYPSKAQAASQTWTSQSDWQSGSQSNVDTTSSSGDLKLSSSGSSPQTISFRAASHSIGPGYTDKPSGVVDNDVMIAAVAVTVAPLGDITTTTITPPSGWTLVRRTNNSTEKLGLAVYYKVASSEGSSYTWTLSTGNDAIGIMAYSGVDTSNPIDVENGQETSSGLSHSTPSITTTVASTMLVTNFTQGDGRAVWSPPGGETERYTAYFSSSNGTSSEGNDETKATAGSTGIKTATVDNYASGGVTHILALKPGSATTYNSSGTDTIQYNSGSSGTTWSALSWNGSTPSGTTIKARARTSESQSGLSSASWSSYVTTSGGSISLTGQWVEVEWNLSTTDTSTTPTLNDGTIAYTTSSGSSSGGGNTSTPTPTPSSGSSGGTSGGSTTTTTTTTSGGGRTTVITKVAKDACTSEFTELTLAATDTRANLKFKSLNSDLATWYIYENKRAAKSGTPPVGYDKDSLFVRDRVATKDHDLTKDGLKPETTYYYAVAASVKGKTVVTCEYSFTTVATAVSVTNALTGNVYLDTTKTGIAGVTMVLAKKTGSEWRKVTSTTTDEKGAFTIPYEPGNDEYYLASVAKDGYYFGLTPAKASCNSRARRSNIIYFDQTVKLAAGGCRTEFYFTKINDTDPIVAGKVVANGTTTGLPDIPLYIYNFAEGTTNYMGLTRTNPAGEWSFHYPVDVPIFVAVVSSPNYLFGPDKVKYGCPGDTTSTYSFRWQKQLLPKTGCAGNIVSLSIVTPPDPILTGKVLDANKVGVTGIRMDLLTNDGTVDQLAGRVYTDPDGTWRFKVKPNTHYKVTMNFDLTKKSGFLPGPEIASSDCPTTQRTTSSLEFDSIPTAGCLSNIFNLTSLTGGSSFQVTGNTLSDLTHTGVAGIPITLSFYDTSQTGEAIWRIVDKVYSDPAGQFKFTILQNATNTYRYYINTGAIPGQLLGFSLPTTNCPTKDNRYPQRLTFVKAPLTAACQMAFYFTPADGQVSGTNYLANSTTGLNNSYLRLYKTINRSLNVLTYSYSNKLGDFATDCRQGVTDYKLKVDPAGQTIQNIKLKLLGKAGERILDSVARTAYTPIQVDECIPSQPLDLKVSFSPAGGTFENAVTVSITATSTDPTHIASVYYTINGTDPTPNNGVLYRRPIDLTRLQNLAGEQTIELRARAYGSVSPVEKAIFILKPAAAPASTPTPSTTASPTPTPSPTTPGASVLSVTADPPNATRTEPVTVTLNALPAGRQLTIYYTTDGSDPVVGGAEYKGPLTFNATTILKFYAKDPATNEVSAVATGLYNITNLPTTEIHWTPVGGGGTYTVNCNGRSIGTTNEATFIDPVSQADGCAYTVATDLGPVNELWVKGIGPVKAVVPTAVRLAQAAAAAGGVALVTAGTGNWFWDLIGTLLTLPALIPALWLQLLALLGFSKKRQSWGRALNSLDNRPISLAVVSLVDQARKVIAMVATDREGRYGFLVEPGNYSITAHRVGFTYPSHFLATVYQGTPFKITSKQNLNLDLYLDPNRAKEGFGAFLSRWRLAVAKARLPILIVGSLVTIYSLFQSIEVFTLLVAGLYLIYWLIELINLGKSHSALKLVDETSRPLPHTLFRLFKPEGRTLVTTGVTDTHGEAFLLVPAGQYQLVVATPRHPAGLSQAIALPKGIAVRNMTVKINY